MVEAKDKLHRAASSHSSASSREASRSLEEQPFLEPETVEINKKLQKTSPGFTPLSRIIFFLLLVLTALALTVVTLGKIPSSSQSNTSKYDHPDEQPSSTPQVVLHHEDVPPQPRVRPQESYILPSSWDFKAAPKIHEYKWTIVDAVLNPDGIFRPMILINNIFPGPLIECNDGDTIVVHINNQASNATAIHFHGLFQNGTNAVDGTVGVTQCAIAPKSSFTYRFEIKGQSGTYWYHAHHSAQASDGLVGPIVVHDKEEKHLQMVDYETDRVLMVQDHYHNLTSELLMEYLQPDQENEEPVPDNGLINGHGVRSCTDFPGWPCDDHDIALPTINLTKGQRHRLRIINVGAFAEFQIQLDEHPFYITEVDGVDVHPEPFHRLNILAAQRYSVVVETNVSSADAFWMRARMVTACFAAENERLEVEAKAVIRYIDSKTAAAAAPPQQLPESKEWPDPIEGLCRDLNTTLLRPVIPISPPPATDVLSLRANFEIGAWRLARGFFNDSTWHMNATHPSLHRFLDSLSSKSKSPFQKPLHVNNEVFDRERELVIQTSGIRTVDIIINNFDDGSHPFHLHGHRFFLLTQATSGYPPTPEDLPEFLLKNGQMDNPLRRDVVTVQPYAWAILRVVLDNPGFWTLHCHNTWHAEAGMVMQMLVREEVVRTWEIDPPARSLCERKGVTTGIRPHDSIWFGQF